MEWISVNDRMPDDCEIVIVTVKYGGGSKTVYPEGRYNKDKGLWEWSSEPCFDKWFKFTGSVTHWMPLPKAAED